MSTLGVYLELAQRRRHNMLPESPQKRPIKHGWRPLLSGLTGFLILCLKFEWPLVSFVSLPSRKGAVGFCDCEARRF